jgi:hypothetical protein
LSSEKLEISQTINPFSKFSKKLNLKDIYTGNEKISFRNRHPIFKSLLRIEFEDAIRDYLEIK